MLPEIILSWIVVTASWLKLGAILFPEPRSPISTRRKFVVSSRGGAKPFNITQLLLPVMRQCHLPTNLGWCGQTSKHEGIVCTFIRIQTNLKFEDGLSLSHPFLPYVSHGANGHTHSLSLSLSLALSFSLRFDTPFFYGHTFWLSIPKNMSRIGYWGRRNSPAACGFTCTATV